MEKQESDGSASRRRALCCKFPTPVVNLVIRSFNSVSISVHAAYVRHRHETVVGHHLLQPFSNFSRFNLRRVVFGETWILFGRRIATVERNAIGVRVHHERFRSERHRTFELPIANFCAAPCPSAKAPTSQSGSLGETHVSATTESRIPGNHLAFSRMLANMHSCKSLWSRTNSAQQWLAPPC